MCTLHYICANFIMSLKIHNGTTQREKMRRFYDYSLLKVYYQMVFVWAMSNFLEKMSLGYLDHIDENITPDIVCMYSLFELNQLAPRNHSEIIALRIACTYQVFRWTNGMKSRWKRSSQV